MTHAELLQLASTYQISAIAFTDHDSLVTPEVLSSLSKDSSTKWISGIEISSDSNLHIVGLFVDPTNPNLLNHCELAQKSRINRMQKIVVNLKNIGFNISVEDCLKASGGESVGRPHIVEALMSHSENLITLDKLRQKMADDSTVTNKYEAMMQRGPSQYPYVLLLSSDAYFPNIYVDTSYQVNLDQSVALIRQAGGLAFIAHYSTIKNKISLPDLEKILANKRVDGMETIYGIDMPDWQSDCLALQKLAEKSNLLISGGSDVHTADQLMAFANNKEYSHKTIGLVKKIISTSGVDTTWSSF